MKSLGILLLLLGSALVAFLLTTANGTDTASATDGASLSPAPSGPPGAELDPASSLPGPEGSSAGVPAADPEDADSARGFLRTYPGGEAILEHYELMGTDMVGWPAPPPLEEVKDALLESMLLTPESMEQQVVAKVRWSESWTADELLGYLGLEQGDLAPGVSLDSARVLARPYNERLRTSAELYFAERNAAIASEFQISAKFSPYTTETQERFPEVPGGYFFSKSTSRELWACKVNLAREHYPQLLEAKREITALVDERDRAIIDHLRGA